MNTSKNSPAFTWLMALLFTAITVGMLIFIPQWFWVPLPFMLTFIVQSFRAI